MLGFKPSLPPPERPLDRPGLSDWTDAYDNSGHIPDAAAYLAGEQAAYVNGHILFVDGGFVSVGIQKE